MKTLVAFSVCAAVLGALHPPTAVGQGGSDTRGNRARSAGYARLFNPSTVETISATVRAVEHIAAVRGAATGVHLMVQAGSQTLDVHLGPSWYVDRQVVGLAPGDVIEVRGSRVMYGGKPAIIAASVLKGGEVLKLRAASGIPLWSDSRRR